MTQLKKRAVWGLFIWGTALIAAYAIFFWGEGRGLFSTMTRGSRLHVQSLRPAS